MIFPPLSKIKRRMMSRTLMYDATPTPTPEFSVEFFDNTYRVIHLQVFFMQFLVMISVILHEMMVHFCAESLSIALNFSLKRIFLLFLTGTKTKVIFVQFST